MASKSPQKLKELRSKAESLFGAQKLKKALELYLELDESSPNDPRVVQRIGDIYRRLNDKAEALSSYKRLANLYMTQGFWAKAMAINKVILELDPNETSIQQKLAKTYASGPKGARETEMEPINLTEIAVERTPIELSSDDEDTEVTSPPSDDLMYGNMVDLSESQSEGARESAKTSRPKDQLRRIPLFSEMNIDEFVAVVDRLAVRKFSADALVCEEGDLGQSMYIIADGLLEVFLRDKNGEKLKLGMLRAGDFFGEYGLLTNGRRNASVQCKMDVELLEITSHDFDVIAAQFPRVWNILEEHVRERLINNTFTKSDVFRVLSTEERRKLIQVLKTKKYKAGAVITPEGTPGEEMYFIQAGTVTVMLERGENEKILVSELGPGDYFGEVSMLTGKPRTATVRAKSDCELLELRRTDAAPVFKGNQKILMGLKTKMGERAQDTIEAFRSYTEAKNTLNMV